MKQKPSLITSPPWTAAQIAESFKISKKRQKELQQLMLEIEAKMAKNERRNSARKSKASVSPAAKRRKDPVR